VGYVADPDHYEEKGTNVVVIDPKVLDVFPDGKSVNETLRALAPVIRQQRRRKIA